MRGRSLSVAPRLALVRGLLSIVLVAGTLASVDRVIVAGLVRKGELDGALWQEHNDLMRANYAELAIGTGPVREWPGHLVELEKRSQRRVLVMGDSFVWGSPYLSLNHMWWRQLEIELHRRGYRDVEVIAAGDAGFSTRQQLEAAREVVADFNPDLIIWGYVTNDPDEGLVEQLPVNSGTSGLGRIVLPVAPEIGHQLDRLRNAKQDRLRSGSTHGYEYTEWEQQLLTGPNWRAYATTINELSDFVQSTGLPGFMITLPNSPSPTYFEPRYGPVLPLWRDAGITVVDSLAPAVEAFGDHSAKVRIEWGINPNDGHPGPRMAKFHALVAADHLEQQHADVLGPKHYEARATPTVNDWLPHDLQIEVATAGSYRLRYPTSDRFSPVVPLDAPAVQLALREPTRLQEVAVEGASADGRMWATFLHADERFDDTAFHELENDGSGRFRVPSLFAERELSLLRYRDPAARGTILTVSLENAA